MNARTMSTIRRDRPRVSLHPAGFHAERAHPTVGGLQAGLARIEEDTKKVRPAGCASNNKLLNADTSCRRN
jgi:hypothetical protein